MNSKIFRLLIIFKENKDQPKGETDEKWCLVGFFSSFMAFSILGMPLLLLAGQLEQVPKLSFAWFALLIGMAAWPISCLFTLKWILRFSHNFGLIEAA